MNVQRLFARARTALAGDSGKIDPLEAFPELEPLPVRPVTSDSAHPAPAEHPGPDGQPVLAGRPPAVRRRGSKREKAGLDLSGQDLRGLDLTGKNLRRANLVGSWLMGADLTDTDLRDADLRDADLTDARGLTAHQLGGSVMRGARVPAALARFDALATVDNLSRGAGRLFLALMAVCALALIALAQTNDVQLLSDSGTVRLPLLLGEVSARLFFRATPLLLLALYAGFQLYLLRLWDAVAQLPAVFPDGRRFDERGGGWPLLGFARSGFHQLRHRRPPFAGAQDFAYSFLAFYLAPCVLAVFWARYLVHRSPSTTALQLATVVVAVALGGVCVDLCRTLLQEGKARKRGVSGIDRYFPALLAAIALAYLTHSAFNGVRVSSRDPLPANLGRASGRVWFPMLLKGIGLSPFANLHDLDATTRPATWGGREDEFAVLQAARLAGADLRYADAWKAFLANADLEEASLQGADLTRADLRHAHLFEAHLQSARLQGADLRHADLTRANLEDTTLSGARLQLAHLRAADLRRARFGIADEVNADLTGANLEHALLEDADLRNTNLHGANLQYADLTDSRLQHANLNGADLRNTVLGGINLTGATYNRDTKWPPNFNPAQMGARLLPG